MTVIALAKVVGGMLVFTGVLSVEDNTTLLAQIPQIITTLAALVPLGYSLWHSGEVVAGVIKKILVRLFDKGVPADQGFVPMAPEA